MLRILITVDADRINAGVVLPHAYATQVEFLRQAGNDVQVFGVDDRTSIKGVWRNIRELCQKIDEFHPDLIVAYYGTVVAAITRWVSTKTPYVLTFRGSDLLGTSNSGWVWRVRDWLGRFLSLWAASNAQQIIVNGAGLYQSLPIVLRDKSHNIPNGIDTEIFSPLALSKARIYLGWHNEEKVILFNAGVGSGQVVKNRKLAEETVKLLSIKIPTVRLESISNCSREEVALRMNASDALLVTSLHEGSPDLVKEAMACNLPVVSVPCGDVPERLKEVTQSSIQPYDASMLADALEGILHSGERSDGRSQLFAQKLDVLSVTKQVLSVYMRAIS